MAVIHIVDESSPEIADLNLQIDDLEKIYELECLVKFTKLDQTLTDGNTPSHQYTLVLQEVSKFKEED